MLDDLSLWSVLTFVRCAFLVAGVCALVAVGEATNRPDFTGTVLAGRTELLLMEGFFRHANGEIMRQYTLSKGGHNELLCDRCFSFCVQRECAGRHLVHN